MTMESPCGREMTKIQRWKSRVGVWLTRLRRKLPYVAWYGDELDVRVCFSEAKLPEGQTINEAMHRFYSGRLFEAEKLLREYGVNFDSGMGFQGRDWEWDFSLQGPVSVAFRGRAANPERRHARPKPKLVINNEAA